MNLEAALAAVADQHMDVIVDCLKQQPDFAQIGAEILDKQTWGVLHITDGALEVMLAGATNRAIPLNDIPDDMATQLAALLQKGAS